MCDNDAMEIARLFRIAFLMSITSLCLSILILVVLLR